MPGSEIALHFVRVRFLDDHVTVESPQVLDGLRALLGGPQDELAVAIKAWARRHRLLKDDRVPRWILRTAQMTLKLWTISPASSGWNHAPSSGWSVLTVEDTSISIKTSWDPEFETREDATARIHADLNAQVDQIAEKAASMGAKTTTEKRRPEHFGWVARYVINGEAPESISASGRPYNATVGSVKQALRETATLLGLTLPPFPPVGKRGRPPKASSRSRRSLP